MNVNAFMNGYFPKGDEEMFEEAKNRMEKDGPNRNIKVKDKVNVDMYKKSSPFINDLFPGNKEVAQTFQILKMDYGFTSDMLWRIAEKLNELRKQNDK